MSIVSRRLRSALLTAVLAVGAVCVTGCSKKQAQEAGGSGGGNSAEYAKDTSAALEDAKKADGFDTFVDSRDGKVYKKVIIGNQTWMAENLAYAADTSNTDGCYNGTGNAKANCAKYGRLYSWDDIGAGLGTSAIPSGIRGICPAGWHLPSRQEWDDLAIAAGGKRSVDKDGNGTWKGVGKKLKTAHGWDGTNDYGFSALPGGRLSVSISVDYDGIGECGEWWTTTGTDQARYYSKRICGNDMEEETGGSIIYYSVRCVKDDGGSGTTPTHAVTVISKGKDASGSGKYAAGARVVIHAGTAPIRQHFKTWTVISGGVTFTDSTNKQKAAFKMPANDVTVTANFEEIAVKPGTFTDSRDGKTYKTTTIGSQTWMAENLTYSDEGSGYLYGWETAKSVCPAGWHLPTAEEWRVLLNIAYNGLMKYQEYDECAYWLGAGTKLKAKSGWDGNGNGTDEFGFSALPDSGWWSSTALDGNEYTIYEYGVSGNGVCESTGDEWNGNGNRSHYVRCLKD